MKSVLQGKISVGVPSFTIPRKPPLLMCVLRHCWKSRLAVVTPWSTSTSSSRRFLARPSGVLSLNWKTLRWPWHPTSSPSLETISATAPWPWPRSACPVALQPGASWDLVLDTIVACCKTLGSGLFLCQLLTCCFRC